MCKVFIARMNSTVNSAGKESAHNQSESSTPKMVVRKESMISARG